MRMPERNSSRVLMLSFSSIIAPCCDRAVASTVKRDAYDSTQVALISALLGIAGHVDLTFRATVASETRRRIILGDRDAEGRAAFAFGNRRVELSFRPGC